MSECSRFSLHRGGWRGWSLACLSVLLCVASPRDSEASEREASLRPLKAASPPPPSPIPPSRTPPNLNPPPPASVMFLLDASESMQDFAEYLPEDSTPGFYPPPSTDARGQRGWVGAKEGDFIDTGCTDPALVSAMSWFDKNSPDPAKNGSVTYDADPDFGSTPFFEKDKFYTARGRRLAWQTEDYDFALGWNNSFLYANSTSLYACMFVVDYNYSDFYGKEVMNECQTCLDTVGWWRGPRITNTTQYPYTDSDYPPDRSTQYYGQPPTPDAAYRKWVLSGRVLNVRPPKFVVARKALKDVLNSASNVRMGVATFGTDHGWFDPPQVLADMGPSCDKSSPSVDPAAINRTQLTHAVNTVTFNRYDRATGESLFGLGGYFSSQRHDNKWSNWFSNPINPGYFGWPGCCNGGTYDEPPGTPGHTGAGFGSRIPDEWTKGPETDGASGTYRPGQPWEPDGDNNRSVCFANQTTAVILITGGTPLYDNAVPITRMMEILKAQGARHADGSLVQFDPVLPETNPNVGGINYCDQVVKNPVTGEKYTKADCDYTAYNWPTGLGVGNKNFMDDVSFFLSHTDLRDDLPGAQTVRTYVVGYGDSSPMNQSISIAGQGHFYRANNTLELQQALQQILAGL